MKRALLALAVFVVMSQAWAGIKTEVVEYKDGGTTLEGYLAYNTSLRGLRPGILVIHEWDGLGRFVKGRVEKLAKLGYVAFAPDIYGKGVRPQTMDDCSKESTKYKSNRSLMRQRVKAGLEVLKKNELVDANRLAAIGYCFGGGVALELARSGAPLAGFVCFHGNLDTPNPNDAKNIKGKVLVFQGGKDEFTKAAVPALEKEMKDANVDFKLVTYKKAVHGFTNPKNLGTVPGLKYDKEADLGSWKAMKRFFKEIFK